MTGQTGWHWVRDNTTGVPAPPSRACACNAHQSHPSSSGWNPKGCHLLGHLLGAPHLRACKVSSHQGLSCPDPLPTPSIHPSLERAQQVFRHRPSSSSSSERSRSCCSFQHELLRSCQPPRLHRRLRPRFPSPPPLAPASLRISLPLRRLGAGWPPRPPKGSPSQSLKWRLPMPQAPPARGPRATARALAACRNQASPARP